jgi:hypothetical protein
MRHHDAAQRTCQIPCSKDAKGLSLSDPIRQVSGKEQFADHGDKKYKNDEVVELQCSTK